MRDIKQCKKCEGDVREVIIPSFPPKKEYKCIECGLIHSDEKPELIK